MDITANDEKFFRLAYETQNTEYNLFDYLTKLGEKGWEMVNALPWWGKGVVLYIFKRPIG